jgi:hypothetical protein
MAADFFREWNLNTGVCDFWIQIGFRVRIRFRFRFRFRIRFRVRVRCMVIHRK